MGKRNISIDVMRGIAMLLVIVHHNLNDNSLSHFISSFHMPLFFIISGLLIKDGRPNNSFGAEILKNSKLLLLPQLCLGIFECIFTEFLSIVEKGELVALSLIDVINAIFQWWFLLVLFQCRVILYLFKHIRSRSRILGGAFLIILIMLEFQVALSPNHFEDLPLFINIVPISLLFILLGNYLRPWFINGCNLKEELIGGFFILITFILSQINGPVFMYSHDFGNMVIFILTAVSASFSVIKFSHIIHSSSLQWIGRMTMPIYVFQFHINQYSRGLEKLILNHFGCYIPSVKMVLAILLSIIICTVLTHCVSKYKITRLLLGLK